MQMPGRTRLRLPHTSQPVNRQTTDHTVIQHPRRMHHRRNVTAREQLFHLTAHTDVTRHHLHPRTQRPQLLTQLVSSLGRHAPPARQHHTPRTTLHHPPGHPRTQRTRTTRHQHRPRRRPHTTTGQPGTHQPPTQNSPTTHRHLILNTNAAGQHLHQPRHRTPHRLDRHIHQTTPPARLLQRHNPPQTPHTSPQRMHRTITRHRQHRTRRHTPHPDIQPRIRNGLHQRNRPHQTNRHPHMLRVTRLVLPQERHHPPAPREPGQPLSQPHPVQITDPQPQPLHPHTTRGQLPRQRLRPHIQRTSGLHQQPAAGRDGDRGRVEADRRPGHLVAEPVEGCALLMSSAPGRKRGHHFVHRRLEVDSEFGREGFCVTAFDGVPQVGVHPVLGVLLGRAGPRPVPAPLEGVGRQVDGPGTGRGVERRPVDGAAVRPQAGEGGHRSVGFGPVTAQE